MWPLARKSADPGEACGAVLKGVLGGKTLVAIHHMGNSTTGVLGGEARWGLVWGIPGVQGYAGVHFGAVQEPFGERSEPPKSISGVL